MFDNADFDHVSRSDEDENDVDGDNNYYYCDKTELAI